MPVTYTFDDHYIRVVFIDGEPWFISEDLPPCLGMSREAYLATVNAFSAGLDARYKLILDLANRNGEKMLTTVYSLETTLRLAALAEHDNPGLFRQWLEDMFEKAGGVLPNPGKACPHLDAMVERLDHGLMCLNGMIDFAGSIPVTGNELHGVNAQHLTCMLTSLRDTFKAAENLVTFVCKRANGGNAI